MSRRLNDPPPITRPKPAAAVKTDVLPPPRKKKKTRKPHVGRFETLNRFVDEQMRELLPAQRAVWLCVFRDEKNGSAAVSQSDIAMRCNLSRESVSRAIAELEVRGLIKTLRQGGLHRGMSCYQIVSKK